MDGTLMNFDPTVTAVAAPAALAVWFAMSAWAARRREAAKTDVERRRDRIERERAALHALTFRQKIDAKMRSYGWFGPPEPLLWGFTLVYLACAAALTMVGVGPIVGVLLSVPASVAVVAVVASNVRTKRRRLFQSQLVSAFDQFAAQLRQGSSAQRAFEDLAPSLPEPLRTEILSVVDQTRSARSLADSMGEVAAKYPSRSMSMFVAALRIGEERGGKLAPALEQAAESLRRDFELVEETNAEIAQERMQFIGIVGIISFIAVTSFARANDEAKEAFASPVGVALLGVFIANFTFGVLRVLRIFSKAKGGV